MRSFLIFLCFVLPLVTVGIVYFKYASPTSTLKPIQQFVVLPTYPELLTKINLRNSKIKNFATRNFLVKVYQDGRRFKLRGSLAYQKEKQFRLILMSVFGKESDLGSNSDFFWFWSKRMNSPSLFFAKHEDYHKTRLKTPFNPMYIMESLGIDQIELTKSKTAEVNDKLIVIESMLNSIGEPISRFIYIDKATERIEGFFIIDKKGAIQVCVEVKSWDGFNPKEILYIWFEENVSMIFTFEQVDINSQLDDSLWELPEIRPQVDMGTD